MDSEKHDGSKQGIYGGVCSDESSPDEGLFTQDDVGKVRATHRGLKSRHIQFLALGIYFFISIVQIYTDILDTGGCIGTGLFVGSGQVLSLVGPAPLLMSYIAMSSIIWVVMNNLGEMTTYMPLGGVSVPYFVKRYCEPSLAFAAGE
jgi:amino acid transporter